jgi:pSer/pThr/pTyr-binding forkhead associated (FHA) protein
MWILRAVEGGEPVNLSFRLRTGHVKTMGRAPRADFIVDAPLVSRLHCRVSVDESGQIEMVDLDSTNGTWVNSHREARAFLKEGDLLRVGRVEFIVERGGPGQD